jgi:hypothetical protein
MRNEVLVFQLSVVRTLRMTSNESLMQSTKVYALRKQVEAKRLMAKIPAARCERFGRISFVPTRLASVFQLTQGLRLGLNSIAAARLQARSRP